MPIVAYYGHPESRVFGRVEFSSLDAARIAVWNDGSLFDLHDTNERTTCCDRIWNSYGVSQRQRQHEQLALSLCFEAESLDAAIDAALEQEADRG